jgi:hypothetical protein
MQGSMWWWIKWVVMNFELSFHLNNMKEATFVNFVQESWWKGVCETNCLVCHLKTLNHQPCKEGYKGCISHFKIFLLLNNWYNLTNLWHVNKSKIMIYQNDKYFRRLHDRKIQYTWIHTLYLYSQGCNLYQCWWVIEFKLNYQPRY